MRRVTHDFRVDLPLDAAWQKLSDLTLAKHYVPSVTDVEFRTEATHGEGCTRRVHLNRKPGWMDETVASWREGQGFVLRLHRHDEPIVPLFRSHLFHYDLAPDGEQTVVTLEMSYEPKGLVSGWISGVALEPAFRRELAAIAANMKALYEAG